MPVGYADHTSPEDPNNVLISTAALAAGFNVLEKHFTVTNDSRIDSQAAVSIETMKSIISAAEVIKSVIGTGNIIYSDSEKKYGDTGPMKKAIVAKKTIKKGEQISMKNIWFKRTNESVYIKQNMLPNIIGLIANKVIEKDEIIDFASINYEFKNGDFNQFKND